MKMNKYMNRAREIKNGTSAFLYAHNQETKTSISKVKTDTMLSPQGRSLKAAEIKVEKGQQLLQLLHQRKNEYVGYLKKAQSAAKEVLKTPIQKASDEEIQEFEKSINDLKTRILLSNDPKKSEEHLKSLVSEIKDPFIASLMREQFASVIGGIISSAGNDANQYKHRLYDLYEGLEKDFLSEEYLEAKNIVEFTEFEIQNNRLVPGLINNEPSVQKTAIGELFGYDVANWIDKTDEYFAKEKNADKALPDVEISDFDEETGEEQFSDQALLERAEKRALSGSVEDKIRLTMLRKELGVN